LNDNPVVDETLKNTQTLQGWLNGSFIRIMAIAQIQRENPVQWIHENTLGGRNPRNLLEC